MAGAKPRARCCTALFALEQRVLMFGGDTYGALVLCSMQHGLPLGIALVSHGSVCADVWRRWLEGTRVKHSADHLMGRAWAIQLTCCRPAPICLHAHVAPPPSPPSRRHQRALVAARPGRGRTRPVDAAAAGGAGTGAAPRPRCCRCGLCAGISLAGKCSKAELPGALPVNRTWFASLPQRVPFHPNWTPFHPFAIATARTPGVCLWRA